ncbi:alpha/beta fold hydrolase [Actinomycetospora termitidis]|uniref:Proline iminopeptidase n=1 Tax=Actinomycetospora termitidis TaxID=3053470 RepID=A0ABT7M119_9PSEU|nr:alpha/beta fold hydrolase [Actinomycetospora sp. Odt1-22]MDL5154354.1 alpha/beta fold hydrolase [Actinomycetospora sp. Odt1-22]
MDQRHRTAQVGDGPFAEGLLDVGGGQQVAWRCHGNPSGTPALVVHGGPGSGARALSWTPLFDLARYRVVLVDQRGCGGSTPDAGHVTTDLSLNTTAHLVADFEEVREHLGIERWVLLGASWGATLAQAYTAAHPDRVRAVVLFSVTCGERRDIDWIVTAMRRLIPAAWERFAEAAHAAPGERLLDAYARLLADPVTQRDAAWAWCAYEDGHTAIGGGPAPTETLAHAEPEFRARFARLVTHYWRHDCFLPDGALLAAARGHDGIPAVLVHGERDISSPPDVAWELARAWRGARLHLVGDEGHGAPARTRALVRAATDDVADGG